MAPGHPDPRSPSEAGPTLDARGSAMALPVALIGPPHLVTQVGAFVEARLGWQVSDGGDLPPRAVLRGVDGSDRGRREPVGGSARVPSVLLVGEDDPPIAAARQARDVDAVLAWPGGHDRLGPLVTGLLGRARADDRPSGGMVVVAGAAGGVGATTVTLALAARRAWGGTPTLAVCSGPVPVPSAPRLDPAALAGHRAWPAAVAVPDVPDLRVVGVAGRPTSVAAPPGVRAVVDLGAVAGPDGPRTRPGGAGEPTPVAVSDPDVLVLRADRVGVEALAASPAVVAVVVGTGARSGRDVATAAAGRPVVRLPWSARVARGFDRQRLPGSLPGSVVGPLADLDDLLDEVARGVARLGTSEPGTGRTSKERDD